MSQLIDLAGSSENNMSTNLVKQIVAAITNIRWGSVEIYIQDNKIVQITERNIRKPQVEEKSHHNGKVTS